jgi:hypothetical protein
MSDKVIPVTQVLEDSLVFSRSFDKSIKNEQ